MSALREAGLTGLLGIAPGPANGFTLDLITAFERFGDRLDWAMLILNPMEPWPGELALGAAARHDISVLARVVDYGGLFWDDVTPARAPQRPDHRAFRPAGWIEAGRERLERMRPIAERHGLTMLQLAAQWDLAHGPVRSVAPTLIQEAGPGARPVEDKRAELAATPAEVVLSAAEVDELRAIGDNAGSMALKGGVPTTTARPSPTAGRSTTTCARSPPAGASRPSASSPRAPPDRPPGPGVGDRTPARQLAVAAAGPGAAG